MKKNMGSVDRLIRFMLSIALAALFYTGVITGAWSYWLLGFGVVFLLTSMIGNCPLYTLLGITTNKVKKQS